MSKEFDRESNELTEGLNNLTLHNVARPLLLYRKERPQVAAAHARAVCRAKCRTDLRVHLVVLELSRGGGLPGHHPANLHSEGNASRQRYA